LVQPTRSFDSIAMAGFSFLSENPEQQFGAAAVKLHMSWLVEQQRSTRP